MAKRFTETEIWDEDWFLEMPNEYKLFWYYILSSCNHAGIFRVNLRKFCDLNGVKITASEALSFFNSGKNRIRIVSDNVWFIEDFFFFQYGGSLNRGNRVHKSIEKVYNQYDINLTSIRGLKVVLDGSKRSQNEDTDGVKDKDKDINTEEENLKLLDSSNLSPKMIAIYKQQYPTTTIDLENDFKHCVEIAKRIATTKGWNVGSVVNGKMDETLDVWRKVVLFTSKDNWFSTRTLRDLNTHNEWERLVKAMSAKPKKEEPKQQPTAPPLKRY